MFKQWVLAVGVAVTVMTSGCSSSDKPADTASAVPASSAAVEATDGVAESAVATSEPDFAVTPLDSSECVDVTGASLDLSVATTAAEVRTAADTLEKYGPPAAPKAAIEHFVSTIGAQFDDPEYTKQNEVLDAWVHQLCPV